METCNDNKESAAVNIFEKGVRSTYISHLRRKDHAHFGTTKGERGPLEAISRKLEFKPLVFGTFGEMSDGVKEVLEIAVDYGTDYLGGAWEQRQWRRS